MINGLRECDQILNAMWLQSQEDEQTIANLTKKISQFATKREEDQNIINSLREENTQLRIKMFQMVAQFQQLQEKQDQKLVQPTDTKVQAQHHLQQALDQLLQVLGAQELTENAQPVPENMQEEKTESQIESVASTLSNKFWKLLVCCHLLEAFACTFTHVFFKKPNDNGWRLHISYRL